MIDSRNPGPTSYEIAAWIVTGSALLLTLTLHLLPALLAGLLVYELVHVLAAQLRIGRLVGNRAKVAAVALLAGLIILFLTLFIWGLIVFFRSDSGSVPVLLKKMAEIIEKSRVIVPDWLGGYMPDDMDGFAAWSVKMLREHAGELQMAGKEAGRTAAHIIVGMVIGALISLREATPLHESRPLATALLERAARFGQAFRAVVFAQVRIAALNTFFAWLYLGILLPVSGVHLPLVKTMLAITFITGLLPVVGNLISNAIIVVVSLSYSPSVAVASLGFLVVVHKLEYFLNARIVGTRIHARAWELLLAMLVMEAGFGIAGVIAAPIYYAYIKNELVDQGLL